MNPKSFITIFTDGASRGNPGPGGFGAIVIVSENNDEIYDLGYKIYELGGREEKTTNNRMELRAAIESLSFLSSLRIKPARRPARRLEGGLAGGDKGLRISVHTDSAYMLNGITRWVHGWQKNGWKTKNKKAVLNGDLWRTLLELTEGKSIEWRLVGGHIGVAGNNRADEIATAFAEGKNPTLYEGSLAEYPVQNILDVTHDRGLARERSAHRARSNTKAYSYVSLVDGYVETHKTWSECEARVKGKQARYRKVCSADEERKLIAEWTPLEIDGRKSRMNRNNDASTFL